MMRTLLKTAGWSLLVLILFGNRSYADRLLPEYINQVIIYTERELIFLPSFYIIFSSEPIDESINRDEFQRRLKAKDDPNYLILKVGNKQPVSPRKYSYLFGTLYDKNASWNNGNQFHWKDWEYYSADIWDNIGIAYVPENENSQSIFIQVDKVVVRRGSNLLLDTRKEYSFPNRQPMSIKLPEKQLGILKGTVQVLDLSREMELFKQHYYELSGNILKDAYSDLGQTDKNKYTRRGDNWCSEFISSIYRQNNIISPDPNRVDVHSGNLKWFIRKNGKVYTFKKIKKWNNEKKRSRILPGSIVSICINNCKTTHTLLFTSWIEDPDTKELNSFTAISGNNKDMVWFHEPVVLDQISNDRQNYIAVHEELPQ